MPRTENRPLYPYLKPSEVYHCPEDKGCWIAIQISPPTILKPTCWEASGCSYAYNFRALGFVTKNKRDGYLDENKVGWVPEPSRFILFSEAPARQASIASPEDRMCSHWHERKGPEDILKSQLPSDPSKFISPVAFVDGHVAVHDFTKTIKKEPGYPYEETKDWIWYKPKVEETTGL